MMTSSNGYIFYDTGHLCGEFTGPGEFPAQRPVTRSFGVFFHLRLNKRLSKQWWGWWFETASRPLWRHRNVEGESRKCPSYQSIKGVWKFHMSLQWRHNELDSVSDHQPHECLVNGLFRRRSKKTSKLRYTGLCAGYSPATGEFPAQEASNAENVSIWWRHHGEINATFPKGQWIKQQKLGRASICITHHIISLYKSLVRYRG